ncbi:MAG: amidase [Pseudomonadota bacterium]
MPKSHLPEDRKSRDDLASRTTEGDNDTDLDRRSFLQLGALAGATAGLGALPRSSDAGSPPGADALNGIGGLELLEATIEELQELQRTGQLTAVQLTRYYLQRIREFDQRGGLNSVIELNPDALAIARQLDRERRQSGPRGPLHGIPIMMKANIDTADAMQTTAGSLALVGQPALEDATVAARLRDAGAVLLGKLNLSEWANFRGFSSSSGWCGVAGQCNNPYITDRNPCGSSSGTGAAVSANLCAAALGTETDGSIVCPASATGVVGIKPTVGLTSRAGVVPISDTQDTVGIHGRTVADAAALLGPLTGVDPRDAKTAASDGNFFDDYSQFADPDGLQGARIGVARQFLPTTAETDAIFEQAVTALSDAGATVVDPVEFPSFAEFAVDDAEIIVLVFEFKRDLNTYLATRTGVPVSTVADVIEFNLDNFDAELKFFGQELFELAEGGAFSEDQYLAALDRGFRLAATEGIDAVLQANNLDAIIAPTGSPAWPNDIIAGDSFQFGTSSYAAVVGYPLVTVPAGFAFGLPVGMTFIGARWAEPTLIRVAAGFEAATQVREPPRFLPTFTGGFPPARPGVHFGARGPLKPAATRVDDRRSAGRPRPSRFVRVGDLVIPRPHSL